MITRTFTLVLLLLTTVCKAQTADYAGSLKGCFTETDISLLNEACRFFELQLNNHYKNQPTGQVYKSFLDDVSAMNLPPQFFITAKSKEMIVKLRSGKTFEKIWTRLNESESFYDIKAHSNNQQPANNKDESGYYCMAPNGIFLNCLIEKNTIKVVTEYLEARRKLHGISPAITANMLKNGLKTEDFDNGLTRLIMAIGFYYEIGLLTNNGL